MNLVEQIFQQAQAGSANGQGFGASFAEGVQAGQRQQQLDVRKRELAMELAQAPLKQTLLQQDTEMNAAKLQMFLQGRADEAMATQAFAGLAGQVSPLLAEGKIDEAQNALLDAGVNNAFLLNDPRFKSLYDYTTKAQDAKLALVNARHSTYTPGIGVTRDPLTGEERSYFMSSPNSAQLVKDPATVAPSNAQKNFTQLDALQRALAEATASGDPNAIAEAKRRLDTFGALATPPTQTVYDPKTGNPIFTSGKPLGDVTVATATRLQEGLQSAISNIDVANRLEPLISTETVGARAFAESWIKDRVLAQAFPELASGKRANAEALAAQLRAASIQQLKSDGNISDREIKQILQAVPEINSPIDSPARAKQLIQASRKMAAIHAVVAATKLKQPVPGAAAQSLSTSELKQLVDTGVITKEQALAAFDAK